ncbi:serine hydrolase [Edaphobacter modestus]|uniref:CubicO group peptidase (Beta-lactamase class C family) n=1 Tax=Edaphobacter modestus TaxID=388466 RepID=A0A4Q7YR87_9BACT|nr:serine hydrolase [Edaphobacter modestus]RZU39694.1 CubicO group peptidase (beta-lactamase class C family) [Edaphobacter modestus]
MNRCVTLAGVCAFLVGQVSAAQTVSPDVQRHIDKVVGCLHEPVMAKGDPCISLEKRMEAMHVPGVSVAVIHDGKLEWARGFGVAKVGGPAVTAGTMFQAGSISKPVAAMAALRLVQQKKLALDEDVEKELVEWKLPSSEAAHGRPVTLRELLTHTGGTTVHGFPGYAQDAPVPTLVQVLDGEKPANTPAIRIETEPGTKWNYSGGGFTIMQATMIDAAKEPFPKLLQESVLAPMGMKHSTYEQPLPARMGPAATPYNADGTPVAGGAHTYPEMAAAGLWTTASDLALYVMENQQSLKGKANHVLSQVMTKEMMTLGMGSWGLGVQIGGSEADRYFMHGGVNAGFEALFVGYENHGDGAVVMTNAQGGSRLAQQVMQSIAAEYGWPDFKPVVRTEVKLDRSVLEKYVGTYELGPKFSLTFTLEGDQLISQASGQPAVPVFAESETKFFTKMMNAEIDFVKDDKGEVTGMVLHQGGRDINGPRKKESTPNGGA